MWSTHLANENAALVYSAGPAPEQSLNLTLSNMVYSISVMVVTDRFPYAEYRCGFM